MFPASKTKSAKPEARTLRSIIGRDPPTSHQIDRRSFARRWLRLATLAIGAGNRKEPMDLRCSRNPSAPIRLPLSAKDQLEPDRLGFRFSLGFRVLFLIKKKRGSKKGFRVQGVGFRVVDKHFPKKPQSQEPHWPYPGSNKQLRKLVPGMSQHEKIHNVEN